MSFPVHLRLCRFHLVQIPYGLYSDDIVMVVLELTGIIEPFLLTRITYCLLLFLIWLLYSTMIRRIHEDMFRVPCRRT